MDWKLHVILSLFLYSLIISIFRFSFPYSIAAFILLIFSSLLPDIDHPKSMIRKAVFLLVFYFLTLFIIIELNLTLEMKILILAITLILTYYLYKFIPLRHRGKRSLHLWRYVLIFPLLSIVLFALANINISFA
ncbi:MAG: metal-dependent hydrolase, partial [Candidatus Aenigmatarchaeota archaeon]